MVYSHPALYRILALVWFCITLALLYLGIASSWPPTTRVALLVISAFPLLLALIYMQLSHHEEGGF
jgi:hypothetical protein